MECWYVVQTKPRKQIEAENYLLSKRLEYFNPLMKHVSARNGKVSTSIRPLFPNYLFCRFDYYRDYPMLKWGRGINRVIGFGEYPSPVSDQIVGIIKERTDKNNIVKKAIQWKHKDDVIIKSGPLKDLICIFDRWVSDSDRVRILLKLIGYSTSIELHYSMIEKVF